MTSASPRATYRGHPAGPQVFREADRNDGTTAERLARAEDGMRALERIAVNATPDERQAIGTLEHSLQMLIGALRLLAR